MAATRRAFLTAAAGAGAWAWACAGTRGGPAADGGAARSRRILLLGGTGFLGPAVVEPARARGHAVTIFHRGQTRPGLFPGVEELFGDRDGKLDALRGRTWDAVVDTSGYVPRVVHQSAELLAPSVDRYLFVSSTAVYADTSRPGIDEAAPVATLADPASEDVPRHYGALKAVCERVVEAALPGRALSVRPGLIVGPGDPTDRFTYWPVRLSRGGEVLAPGDGSDPVQVVDVRDLGAFLVRLLEAGATGTFNVTGPASPLPTREFLAACTPAGASPRLVWVPVEFLEELKVSPWSDLPAWVPARGATRGFGQIASGRALSAGLSFRPLPETARDTLAWWRALPEERRGKMRAGLSPESEERVLSVWRGRRG
ncbi:MAG TPA: NAD-dependent epimerase/dehydratase family protein [Anaeromyxobacteraceae bacterium]|nr:NAD-dependent epimerase/dehydratase family protein [Anaeromyxobacteraceae bacterium]